MIKLKKLLAGVLGAAMVLSSMSATAFAAGDADKMPTIDTAKTGSLTIHKYEYNGSDGSTGTGESTDTVPSDATPLAGVKFEVTKIAELTDYYGTDAKALPTVEAAQNMQGIEETIAVTTTDEGLAKFENLTLGLYLVHEAEAPAQITGKAADFLVSIPMTNATEDDWLYDVHVFPKNSSTYAGVTLLKQGKVGDGTAAALAGATFVLQTKGDTDTKWTTVTKNNKGLEIGRGGVLTTGDDGKISVSDLAPGYYRFVETGVPENSGYIMNGAEVKEFVITEGGKVTIDGTETDTTQSPITIVNYKPDVEKEVKDRKDGTWGNDSDYSAGSTVPYRVKVDVPQNVAQLKDFTLSDTMEHQTYKNDTLRIYSDGELTTEILAGSYTVNTSGEAAWSIAFNSVTGETITSLLAGYAGQSVYIYFETVLGEDAVITSAGNPNTVKLEYSNEIVPNTDDGNPNEDNPKEPKKDVITDQAVVYTFKIAVEKVDADDTSKKLAGVEFDLYKKLADNASGDGVLTDPVKGLTGKYMKVNTSSLTTDAEGEIAVNGLENGEYYLVETKTNEGYNLLKAPVQVKIEATYMTTTSTTTVTDENGVTTTTTTTVSNQKFENAGENGVFKTVIKNNKGFTLPTTGGMGSVIFIIGGIALALAGFLIILASRKKTAAQ